MSQSPHQYENPNPTINKPSRKTRPISLPEILLKEVVQKMHQHSLTSTPSGSPRSDSGFSQHSQSSDPSGPDYTYPLSDTILLNVFARLPIAYHLSNSLVCKRWLYLHGRLVQTLKLKDWGLLESGRVFSRFPNLTEIDLLSSCISVPRSSAVLLTKKSLSVYMDTNLTTDGLIGERDLLPSSKIDRGLELIARNYPYMRRITVSGGSAIGLSSIANGCHTLQEIELHCFGDLALKGIIGCRNLQVVKLFGCLDGFYNSVVSDLGLTILAQGCPRLVKLELCGCEGSYDGIKAIGQCCQMLEELTICDHRMEGGWLAGLSFCLNLKTLRLQSCKSIDSSPGPDNRLGSCLTLEELELEKCQLRDKQSMKSLFLVCQNVRDIVLHNCWGLEDEIFGFANACRRVKLLSLEHCSLLTTGGLEVVLLSWPELERLIVVSCNKIKYSEISSELAEVFSVLKELKWRPDSRSLLSSNLEGTGMGKRGGKFFARLKG